MWKVLCRFYEQLKRVLVSGVIYMMPKQTKSKHACLETRYICTYLTWGSGPLLHMAGYSSLQGIGISLLKYRWCYESVQNYGTKLEQKVHTIGGLICG